MPTINFIDDMDDIFLASGFQETVSYTPTGGSATDILAVVSRGGTVPMMGGPVKANKYKYEILVSKTDISSVTRISDKVTLSSKGATDTTHVQAVIYEDQGAFVLGLS